MENLAIDENTSKKDRTAPKNDYIRIRKETKKKILNELSKLNRKDFGRPITVDQYLSKAISLLTFDHLEELKMGSLTNQDRLQQKYEEFCRINGRVTKDDYIGMLLEKKI